MKFLERDLEASERKRNKDGCKDLGTRYYEQMENFFMEGPWELLISSYKQSLGYLVQDPDWVGGSLIGPAWVCAYI